MALSLLAGSLQARSLTDDYGRTDNLPETVTKFYAASPPLTMSVLAFDPALIAALNFPWSDAQRPYAGAAADRPVARGSSGRGRPRTSKCWHRRTPTSFSSGEECQG